MTETFKASFLKIERAKRHLQELEQVVADYLASKPITWGGKLTPDPEKRCFTVGFNLNRRAMPDTVSAILGDFFHNLRSALDLMASDLATNQGNSSKKVYFPFSRNAAGLDEQIENKNFTLCGGAAVKLLKEEVQPYHEGNMALRAIHDLDIQDKHQMLIVNTVTAAGPILDMKPDSNGWPSFVGDPDLPSDIQVLGPIGSPLAQMLLLPTLHKLVDLTAAVVESFKPLCAPTGQPPVIGHTPG